MFYTDSLQSLVDQDQVSSTLFKGTSASWAVRCMQVALYNLGYGDEMNWAKYMADGDYGGGSTRALSAFLQKSGLSGDGTKLEKNVLKKMLVLVAAKDDLAALRQSLANGTVSDDYSQDGGNEMAIKGLQRLLFVLGYGQIFPWDVNPSGAYDSPTMSAVKAFGNKENLPTDGTSVSTDMAKRIKEKVTAFYGGKLDLGGGNTASRVRKEEITVSDVGGRLYAWDTFFKIRLIRHSKGAYVAGNEKATEFIDTYRDALQSEGMTDSALRVMVPVSANEGALDAINTWDNAFLSFGMYQWTMGTETAKGELPALLKRIKNLDPDTFRYYYGRYGMDIDEANSNEVYGRVTLNGVSVQAVADKEKFRDNRWAFRFWRSGLDPMVKLAEMLHAFDRLYSFYHHENYKVVVGNNRYYVDQIVTSEYGVALILDHHVNRPAHPRKHLATAISQAGLSAKAPDTWTTDDEKKVIAKYLVVRAGSSMTSPEKRAATTKKYLDAGKLSDERGSFEWKAGTKSVDGVFPRGLDEMAFPVIDEAEEKRGTVVPPAPGEDQAQPETPPPASTPASSPTESPAAKEQGGWFKRFWKSIFG